MSPPGSDAAGARTARKQRSYTRLRAVHASVPPPASGGGGCRYYFAIDLATLRVLTESFIGLFAVLLRASCPAATPKPTVASQRDSDLDDSETTNSSIIRGDSLGSVTASRLAARVLRRAAFLEPVGKRRHTNRSTRGAHDARADDREDGHVVSEHDRRNQRSSAMVGVEEEDEEDEEDEDAGMEEELVEAALRKAHSSMSRFWSQEITDARQECHARSCSAQQDAAAHTAVARRITMLRAHARRRREEEAAARLLHADDENLGNTPT